MANRNYVTASEIGEFVYCKRAWWLRFNGYLKPTPQMVRGTEKHESLLKRVNLSARLLIIAILLIGIALLSLILLIINLFR